MTFLQKKNKKNQPLRYSVEYKSTHLRHPINSIIDIEQEPTEFDNLIFNNIKIKKLDNDLTLNYSKNNTKALGQEIYIHGNVMDQFGNPQKNVFLEIWQANTSGRYRHFNDKNNAPLDPNFAGCGRYITGSNGYYKFKTIKPGAYPFFNNGIEWRPMHIHFSLFGKFFSQRLITQMYFEGDPLIPFCSILNSIPNKNTRKNLVAKLDLSFTESEKILAYKFDIILRGHQQTYFENKKDGL